MHLCAQSPQMLVLYVLLQCDMAPKRVALAPCRISAHQLQTKYSALLSQGPYAECTSAYYLHKALQARKPRIDITVMIVYFL